MILDTYSIRKNEFKPIDNTENTYKSTIVNGYIIKINFEKLGERKEYETGRILVSHSDGRGRRKFIDVWENDGNGSYYWLCRNPYNVPPTDAVIIRDLEKKLEDIKAAAISLKNSTKIIETKKKLSAGRPKEIDKQQKTAADIKNLIAEGLSDSEIMEKLNLKRATYFRRKNDIKKYNL